MEIAKRLHQPGDSRIRAECSNSERATTVSYEISDHRLSRARLPAYVAVVRLVALQHIADHQRTGINERITRNTRSISSCTKELNGDPDGSLPTVARFPLRSNDAWRQRDSAL